MHPPYDFVQKFHNLEGNTIGERKKEFSKLLKTKNLFSNEQELNNALNNLQPKTVLEDLFYVDTLIRFKKTTKLLDIFKQGNEIHISKIIKQPWFLKEILANSSVGEVVNEVLPCTSFSVRMKLLKKLSQTALSESQMDELFDCVQERYGIHIAIKFVDACSLEKISSILSDSDYEVTLRSNQVKILLDRDLSTFKKYLQYHTKRKGTSYNDLSVIKSLSKKYPEEFLQLRKENKIHGFRVGRRISKKIMGIVKEDVVTDIGYYTAFLSNPVIVRKLGGNFKKVYLDTFPNNLECVNSYFIGKSLAEFYPKKRRWDLFVETFSLVFNQNVHDKLALLDEGTIQLCPDRILIQKWAEIKYAEKNDDRFLEYIEPSKAIAIFKDKINVTSTIHDRLDLLQQMVSVCVQNECMISLEKVLQYFCFRHRNEDSSSRISFLNHIQYHCNLKQFSEKHWEYINEQIDILRVKNEYNFWSCQDFLKRYLEYLFINSKPFQDELATYISDVYECSGSLTQLDLSLSNPHVEREILIHMINYILDVEEGEKMPNFRNHNGKQQLVYHVIEFSMNNKDYFVNLLDFPILLDYAKCIFDKDRLFVHKEYDMVVKFINYNYTFMKGLLIEKNKILDIIYHAPKIELYCFKELITNMVMKQIRSDLENNILHMYFNHLINNIVIHEIHNWFVKNEPQTILPYINNIIRNSLYLSPSFWNHILYLKQVKLLSHFKYDVQYENFYKSQVCNSKVAASNDIEFFSMLNSTDDFITFVNTKFLPKKDKLDLTDEEMRAIYQSQCEVAKLLKNVLDPSKMVPVALKFCVGDYLQSALPSIYSLFYRTPENQLPLYIDILAKGAVSVRKHAVFLSCELLDSNFIKRLFDTVDEKNVSAQKHLFLAILKYFIKRPTPEMFDMLITKLYTNIDKYDKEILKMLTSKLTEIPRKFKARYTEKCWEFYESLSSQVNVDQYLESLLDKILHSSDQYVSILSHEFCIHIINSYFKDQKIRLTYTIDFVCYALKYREAEQEENFHIVFDTISTFKINQQFQQISRFFETAFRIACEDEKGLFINLLSEHWSKVFSALEAFEEFVSLQLIIIKWKSEPPFSDNYAKNVRLFYEQLMGDYGTYIHNKFIYSLCKVLEGIHIDKNEFLYKTLQGSTTPPICVLILDLLPKFEVRYANATVIERILEILRQSEDPIVRIHYNSYMNSTRTR